MKKLIFISFMLCFSAIAFIGCGSSGNNTSNNGVDVKFIAQKTTIKTASFYNMSVYGTTINPSRYRSCITRVALSENGDFSADPGRYWVIYNGAPKIIELSDTSTLNQVFTLTGITPPTSGIYNFTEVSVIWNEVTVPVFNWTALQNATGSNNGNVGFRVYFSDDPGGVGKRGNLSIVVGDTEYWVQSDYTLSTSHSGTLYNCTSIPSNGHQLQNSAGLEEYVVVDSNNLIKVRDSMSVPFNAPAVASGTFTITMETDYQNGFSYEEASSPMGHFEPGTISKNGRPELVDSTSEPAKVRFSIIYQ